MTDVESLRNSVLCRFILNLPPKELQPNRIFYHLQQAHWFFLDFMQKAYPSLEQLSFKFGQFCNWLLKPVFFLSYITYDLQFYLTQFRDYTSQIPLYGGILLTNSREKILLVMNYNRTLYSFPKGKVNENEKPIDCAIREVWEEIGYDISEKISEQDFIQTKDLDNNQLQKLYVIQNVEENYAFKTNTRHEIGVIEWVEIKDIFSQVDKEVFQNVQPFMEGLRKWLKHFKILQKKDRVGQVVQLNAPQVPLEANKIIKIEKVENVQLLEKIEKVEKVEIPKIKILEKKENEKQKENNFISSNQIEGKQFNSEKRTLESRLSQILVDTLNDIKAEFQLLLK